MVQFVEETIVQDLRISRIKILLSNVQFGKTGLRHCLNLYMDFHFVF